MIRHLLLLLVVHLLACLALLGQDTLQLINPSFEDQPRHSRSPRGWSDCGFVGQSPPDTGPSREFRSTTQPAAGQSFLVLVTRDNNTWERVGGTLNQALTAGQAYRLRVQLAKSARYFSRSTIVNKQVNFAFPIRLRLWGAQTVCEARELLAQSPPIDHTDWQTYTLDFVPMLPYPILMLEAYYAAGTDLPYPGNLCVDQLSPVVPVSSTPSDLRERRMIKPPFVRRSPDEDFPVRPVDQARLRELLDQIKPDRVDQGLYELAVYQRSLRQPPWIIFVKDTGGKAARRWRRQLKKQIAAMNLEAHLSVDDYVSVFQTMQWLSTPVADGLGLQRR